jgi:hypothetical protein
VSGQRRAPATLPPPPGPSLPPRSQHTQCNSLVGFLSRPGSFLGQRFLWSVLPGIDLGFLDLPALILAQNLSVRGSRATFAREDV